MPALDYSKHLLPAALALIAAIKLGLLATLGPSLAPDSAPYLHLGQIILDDPAWWQDGGWHNSIMPDRLFRPYGYPLVLAGLTLLSPSHFMLTLTALQSALGLTVLALFGLFLEKIIDNPWLRVCLVLLSGLSQYLLFDLMVLTDSLYASLFLLTFLVIGGQVTGQLRCRPVHSLWAGILWALSITLRDVAFSHACLPLAGIALVAWHHRLGWTQTLLRLALFALPIGLIYVGTLQWNLFRTGHAFFSLTGGINWIWPSVNMRDHGLADPFLCDDPICLAAQAVPALRGMEAVSAIANGVQSNLRLDPISFGQMSLRHFLQTVMAHPFAYMGTILANLQITKLADLAFNPLGNLNTVFQLHSTTGQRFLDGTRDYWQAVRHGHLQALPILLCLVIVQASSLVCLLFTIFVMPVLAFKQHKKPAAVVCLYFWLMAAAFIGSYSLIHMEMRHALPAVALILTAFGYGIQIWRQGKNR